ncbi:hypothetical protein B0T26DRAFT_621578, partial [Lasiosphaeria miniovina]
TGATSTKAQCRQVARLTELASLAANQTRLDEVSKGNATRADALKAKATDGAAQLATLQANSTLMAVCDQVFAAEAMEDACGQLQRMEKLAAVTANATALDLRTDGNATKANALKAKVTADADQLAALQGNATLTAFCAGLDTQDACRNLARLQKEVSLAANTTALDTKFNGNATKVADFQAKTEKAQAKLAALQANTTLTDACASIASTKDASGSVDTATNGSSTSSSGATVGTSGAGSLQISLGSLLGVAALFVGAIAL